MNTADKTIWKTFFGVVTTIVTICAVHAVIVGCEPVCGNSASDAVMAPVTNPPDNTIRLPKCRVIYIGQCPYLWCEREPGAYSSTSSGLTPMREHCEPGNAVVSDTEPSD